MVHRVGVVFRSGFRFGVVSYWQAVLASSDSENGGLFSVVGFHIFRARISASLALEDARIRLLLVLNHTPKLDHALLASILKSQKPSPNESLKYPSQCPAVVCLTVLREFPLGRVPSVIFALLKHQLAWLALLCLCFWRNQFWMRLMISRKTSVGNPAIYIEFLSNPLPYLQTGSNLICSFSFATASPRVCVERRRRSLMCLSSSGS